MHEGWSETLRAIEAAQAAFWTAATEGAAVAAKQVAPEEWQAFDGVLAKMIEQAMPVADAPDLEEARRALAAYRDVLAGAWARIAADFDLQRKAIAPGSGQPGDWKVLRDRWLSVAEAEFIRLQREPEFLSAQSDLLTAAISLLEKIPADQRHLLSDMRRVAGGAAETLAQLGLDGVQIAASPAEAIWRGGKATLSRYRPLPGTERRGPAILICHGLIGRQTMTDLLPDRSLVRQLLAGGVDVFVLDWGSADRDDADVGFDRIVGALLPEVLDAVTEATGGPPVLMGICQGGTFAASLAARGARLRGLILAVTPIDFHADLHDADPAHGLANVWVRSLAARDLERLIELEGLLSGAFLGGVFNQLNPVRTLSKYAIEMVETATDPAQFRTFMAMEKWLADRPDLPARLAREWLIDCYQRNHLVQGRLQIGGEAVDLSRITCPILNVYATGDHIVPPPCSRALQLHVDTSRYAEFALPTGHVGAFVSERAQTLLAPRILRWLETTG